MRADAQRSSAAHSDGSASRGSVFGRIPAATRASSLSADGSGAPSHPRTHIGALALAVALFAILVFAAVPASAALTRAYQASFGTLVNPQSVAVDQAGAGAGDVYVVEVDNGTIQKFDSAGNPVNFSALGTNVLDGSATPPGAFAFLSNAAQVAVDSSGGPADGDIYVSDPFNFAAWVFDASGAYLGSLDGTGTPQGFLGLPTGIAVDPDGRVYLGANHGTVNRYDPSANPVTEADFDTQITGLAAGQRAIAADSTGAVYVTTAGGGPVRKYTNAQFGSNGPAGALIDATATSVAVDPSTDDVYVDEGSRVAVFDSAGAALYSFGSAADFGAGSAGVAVKGSGGDAYVADPTAGEIDAFDPAADNPAATTSAATNIHKARATLNGNADPGDDTIDDCFFEWGTSVAYGNSAPCAEGNSFAVPTDVSVEITGLTPGETYHFRLNISTVSRGDATGGDQSFQTIPVEPRRPLLAAFGPDGTKASSFGTNDSLAFQEATHRLYVLDAGGGPQRSIHGFDVSSPPAHSPLGGFFPISVVFGETYGSGLATDNTALPSAGNIFYSGGGTSSSIYGFDSGGAPLGGNFPIPPSGGLTPCGPAVDSAGNIWFSRLGTIHKYDSAGSPLPAGDITFASPCHIAFDTNGDIYIQTQFNGGQGSQVWKVTAPAYSGPGTLIDSYTVAVGFVGNRQIAVDTSTHHLFVTHVDKIVEYDSAGALVREFAAGIPNANLRGVTVDSANDHVYVSDAGNHKVYEYGPSAIHPDVTTGSGAPLSNTSATLDGTLSPNGVPLIDCHFEYVSEAVFLATKFDDLASGGTVPCTPAHGSIPADFEDHSVTGTATGLDPETSYRFRLVVANAGAAVQGQDVPVPGQPILETIGSPTRTATTARLDARIYPHGNDTTYHFEYGDEGPCDSNPCTATASHSAGSGDIWKPVSQRIAGLAPDTTYHYRVVADNGNPDGSAPGGDFTVTTRASDAPLTHGDLPGPPASDRAWEHVTADDTGGNPTFTAAAISTDGNRAVYQIKGGNSDSSTGTLTSELFAERTPTGWQTRQVFPTRDQAPGNFWNYPAGRDDLSQFVAANTNNNGTGDAGFWRMSPDGAAENVFSLPNADWRTNLEVSEDASRVVMLLGGSLDPDHPVAGSQFNLYDVSDGAPRLIGLLPDGSVPACGSSGLPRVPSEWRRYQHWVSADGDLAFFSADDCSGSKLYVRDIDAEETKLISSGNFIRSTSDAAFFTTASSLAPEDTGGNDVYRYDLGDESIDCVTCVVPGLDAAVTGSIAIPDDGSRVYFNSPKRLLPGAAAGGIYRVDVATGDLAYVAAGDEVGVYSQNGNAIGADGSVIVFRSSSSTLNSVGGPDNAGTEQYYRYDDTNRSLVCVSCPLDGSAPRGSVDLELLNDLTQQLGPNITPLSAAGDFAFATPTSLVSADQNTAGSGQQPFAGADVYEWRDGRLLLVTDGLSASINSSTPPRVAGVTPSGQDVFFIQAAQLTPDPVDAFSRLYDARIGGGFEFPPPPEPCPLEVCQGTPRGAPDDPSPASSAFSGRGNVAEPADCAPSQRAAKRLRRRAASLRRAAKRVSSPKRAKAMRRKAARLSSAAKKKDRRAKRCRANNNRRTAR